MKTQLKTPAASLLPQVMVSLSFFKSGVALYKYYNSYVTGVRRFLWLRNASLWSGAYCWWFCATRMWQQVIDYVHCFSVYGDTVCWYNSFQRGLRSWWNRQWRCQVCRVHHTFGRFSHAVGRVHSYSEFPPSQNRKILSDRWLIKILMINLYI